MNSIRNFFANFKKHGTVSRISGNRMKNLSNKASILANEADATLNNIDLTRHEANAALDAQTDMDRIRTEEDFDTVLQKRNEGTTESINLVTAVQVPSIGPQESIKKIVEHKTTAESKHTTECLKEFDKILEEINRDITEEYVTLDEIDDVINNIAAEEKSKEHLKFEIPRFDLQDLIQNFGLCIENNAEIVEPIDLDAIYDPDELDEAKSINLGQINDLNELDLAQPFNLDKNNETSEYIDYIELNTDTEAIDTEADVISISSEDSQKQESKKLEENKNKEPHEPKNVSHKNGELIYVNDEPINRNDENKRLNDEPRTVNIENIESNVTYQDVVFIDDPNNFERKARKKNEHKNLIVKHKVINDEPKNVTYGSEESNAKSIEDSNDCEPKYERDEPKNVDNAFDVLILKSQDIVSIDDSDDDCGYRSSDFEFITEDEAKMDGLIVNFNLNTLKRKVSKPKRVKTVEVAIDQFCSYNIIDSRHMQEDCPTNIGSESSNLLRNTVDYYSQSSYQENGGPSFCNIKDGYETRSMQGSCPREPRISSLRNVRRYRPRIISRHRGLHNLPIHVANPTSCILVQNIGDPNDSHKDVHKENLGETNMSNIHRNGQGPTIQINCTETSYMLQIDYSRRSVQENGPANFGPTNVQTDTLRNLSLRDGPGIHIVGLGPINSQGNSPSFNQVGPGPSNSQGNSPSFNQVGPGPSNSQGNNPRFNQVGPGPSNSQGNSRSFNQVGPGPSNVGPGTNQRQDYSGPSNLRRNCPETFPTTLKRWRAFENNQNQFVPDQSYRENHRILQDDEYYQLFDPNLAPLPSHSMRLMENKSTMSMGTMLVEYGGVGFEMQMLRENSGGEDEEVKEEANESARIILEMYPGENSKKRRRF